VYSSPAAPWSTVLKIMSAISTVILVGVAYAAWKVVPATGLAHSVGTAVALVPLTVLLVALLFVVAGYEIDGTALRVRRLLWSTTVELEGLTRAWEDLNVIRGSVRVFGNGGLYSFSGIFWSRRLGRYRFFATDFNRCVVLVIRTRTVAVSPADPDAFLRQIRALFPGVEGRDR